MCSSWTWRVREQPVLVEAFEDRHRGRPERGGGCSRGHLYRPPGVERLPAAARPRRARLARHAQRCLTIACGWRSRRSQRLGDRARGRCCGRSPRRAAARPSGWRSSGNSSSTGTPAQAEGPADLAVERDRGEAVEAREAGRSVSASSSPPSSRASSPAAFRVQRGRHQVRAVGGDRVAGRGAQPLGVLVEEQRPHPELRDLLQQRRERSRGGAVIYLHLVEPDVELAAPLGRHVGPRLRARAGRRRRRSWRSAGRGRSPSRGRRGRSAPGPSPRGCHSSRAGCRAGRRWRRGPQPVDQVGDRRDRLGRQPREAFVEEPAHRRRDVREHRSPASPRRSSRTGISKIVGASSAGRRRARSTSAWAAWVVRLSARALISSQRSAEAKASTTASTCPAARCGGRPATAKRFQAGWRSGSARLTSTTRSRSPSSVR